VSLSLNSCFSLFFHSASDSSRGYRMGAAGSQSQYLEPLSQRRRFIEYKQEVSNAPRCLAEAAHRVIYSRDSNSATDVNIWNMIVRCLIVLGKPDFTFDNGRKEGDARGSGLAVPTSVTILKAACAAVKHSSARNGLALFQLGQVLEMQDTRLQPGQIRGFRAQSKVAFPEEFSAETAFLRASRLQHSAAFSVVLQYKAAHFLSCRETSGSREELVREHLKLLSGNRDDQQLWVSLSLLLEDGERITLPLGEVLTKLQALCNAIECDERDPWLWAQLIISASPALLKPDTETDFVEPSYPLTLRGVSIPWLKCIHNAIAKQMMKISAEELRELELLRGERTVPQVRESQRAVWNALGLVMEHNAQRCPGLLHLNCEEVRLGFYAEHAPPGMDVLVVLGEILSRSIQRPTLWMLLALELGRRDVAAYRKYIGGVPSTTDPLPWNVPRDDLTCRNRDRAAVDVDIFEASTILITDTRVTSSDCAQFALSLKPSYEPWLLLSQITSVDWISAGLPENQTKLLRSAATKWSVLVDLPSLHVDASEVTCLEFVVELCPPREVALNAWLRLGALKGENGVTRVIAVPSFPEQVYTSAMCIAMALGCVKEDVRLRMDLTVMMVLAILRASSTKEANASLSVPHSPTYYAVDCLENILQEAPEIFAQHTAAPLLSRMWEATTLMMTKSFSDKIVKKRVLSAREKIADAMWTRELCDVDTWHRSKVAVFLSACGEEDGCGTAKFVFTEEAMHRLLWCLENFSIVSELTVISRRICSVAFLHFLVEEHCDVADLLFSEALFREKWSCFCSLAPCTADSMISYGMLCARQLVVTLLPGAPDVCFENIFLCVARLCAASSDKVVKRDAATKLLTLIKENNSKSSFWGVSIFPFFSELAYVQLACGAEPAVKVEKLLLSLHCRPESSTAFGRAMYLLARVPDAGELSALACSSKTPRFFGDPLVCLALCMQLCVQTLTEGRTDEVRQQLAAHLEVLDLHLLRPVDAAVFSALFLGLLTEAHCLEELASVVPVNSRGLLGCDLDIFRVLSDGLRGVESASLSTALREEFTSDLLTLSAAVELRRSSLIVAESDVVHLLTLAAEQRSNSILFLYTALRFWDEVRALPRDRCITVAAKRLSSAALVHPIVDGPWQAFASSDWIWTQCAKELLLHTNGVMSCEYLLRRVREGSPWFQRSQIINFWAKPSGRYTHSAWHMLVGATGDAIFPTNGSPGSETDTIVAAVSAIEASKESEPLLLSAAWSCLALNLYVHQCLVRIADRTVDAISSARIAREKAVSHRLQALALLLLACNSQSEMPSFILLEEAAKADGDCFPASCWLLGDTRPQQSCADASVVENLCRAQQLLLQHSDAFLFCISSVLEVDPDCKEAWFLTSQLDAGFTWRGRWMTQMEVRARASGGASVLHGPCFRLVVIEWCRQAIRESLLLLV
jgi:hypothetical protein